MSSSDSDVSMEEDQGPNEYDMEDGFMAPDESHSSPEDDGEDEEATEVGEQDLTPEEREIYRQSLQQAGPRRSLRRRKAVDRYQDPEYRRLMTDNGQDAVSDDDDGDMIRHSDREYQPEIDGGFSMDEESEESDSDYSEG